MKKWVTEIKALEDVEAPTMELAQQWCNQNKGYLKVIGELVAEIPCKEGSYEPDFKNMIDYENIQNN